MLKEEFIRENISNVLKDGFIPEFGKIYSGKVRENHIMGDRRLIVTSDRLSAFDVVMERGIPFKGQVLNQLAVYWFEQTRDIVRNHLIEMPDPNCMLVEECEPYSVEVVVRRFLAGSAWRSYEARGEVSGIKLPSGLKEGSELPELIITPTTKSHGGHDIEISRDKIIQEKLVSEKEYEKIETVALQLFQRATEILEPRGLTLVDTKYEFGTRNGELMLIDEIHTPDSSRFWGEGIQDLDKEYVRKWLRERNFMGDGTPPELTDDVIIELVKRYVWVYEQITGMEFSCLPFPVGKRIIYALQSRGIIKGCYAVVIIASDIDMDWGKRIVSELEKFEIPSVIRISSAHKTPERLMDILKWYEKSAEPIVYITVAGRSDALSGMVAANTRFPVIACPPDFNGMDIFSSLRCPSYVAPMVVLSPENASMAAAKIFNLPSVQKKIQDYKIQLKKLDEGMQS